MTVLAHNVGPIPDPLRSSPRFPCSKPSLTIHPLIALPPTHWRKYRKKKRKANRFATVCTATTNKAFPSWPQATSLLPNSHLKSHEALRNEGEPWRTASRSCRAKESDRGRYLGGVEDLLGLLHRVRLLALLEGYRGPRHRQPSAAPRRGPPRRGRPGRDPGRHGGGCCSGHACVGLARLARGGRRWSR